MSKLVRKPRFLTLFTGLIGALSFFSGAVHGVHPEETYKTSTGSMFSYSIGSRFDQLDWNIASDRSGTFTPNILSELSWNNIESVQLELAYSQLINELIVIRLGMSIAAIQHGENQDSDYDGNNRTLEFSRSENNASSGILSDYSGAIGYPLIIGDEAESWVQVTPLLGYSYHRQNLQITDGVQTVASVTTPALGPIAGLNSSYEAQWYGPWIGLELDFLVNRSIQLKVLFEHHRGDLLGTANWNLRTDFQHPRSFEHVASATGNLLSLNLSVDTAHSWKWLFSIQHARWQADPGLDTVFFSNNTIGVTRLNEVNWRASSMSVGFVLPY